MILTYSGRSRPSALAIAESYRDQAEIDLVRSSQGHINWGRNRANTQLNPDISNSTNKRVMRELFEEHGVPMPKLVKGEVCKYELDRQGVDYPIVGRPDRHMKGRGYWYCENIADVRKAVRGTRRKRAATHFMEYIKAEHEYRVHIFKGKSIRISEKSFFNIWPARANFLNDEEGKRTYNTIKPTGRVGKVRQAAKDAVEALGLDFGAVDILVDYEGNPYVLEVNAAPGLGGSTPALYAKVFKEWHEGLWD